MNQLKNLGRYNITLLLVFMTAFCVTLSFIRCSISGTKLFVFLNWNLFLAIIPWIISTIIIVKKSNNIVALILLIITWLLFFPNSPYILTDLFHLKSRQSAPIWFDFILIFSFAWTGLIFGFVSLIDIISLLKKYFSNFVLNCIVVFFLFLSSFGIYLGRYLRWNSWDIISNPLGLIDDVGERLTDPLSHPHTWGMTILMGILLNMMFFSILFLSQKKENKIQLN
jgi:uncharacterized membrane protein